MPHRIKESPHALQAAPAVQWPCGTDFINSCPSCGLCTISIALTEPRQDVRRYSLLHWLAAATVHQYGHTPALKQYMIRLLRAYERRYRGIHPCQVKRAAAELLRGLLGGETRLPVPLLEEARACSQTPQALPSSWPPVAPVSSSAAAWLH